MWWCWRLRVSRHDGCQDVDCCHLSLFSPNYLLGLKWGNTLTHRWTIHPNAYFQNFYRKTYFTILLFCIVRSYVSPKSILPPGYFLFSLVYFWWFQTLAGWLMAPWLQTNWLLSVPFLPSYEKHPKLKWKIH